jgi:PAS domain S-box-containing protein
MSGAARRSAPRKLHRRLVLLVLVALAPVGVVSAVMVSDSVADLGRSYRARLTERARTASLALDREIQAVIVPLSVLTESKGLDIGGERSRFDTRAAEVGKATDHPVLLYGPLAAPLASLPAALLRRLVSERQVVVAVGPDFKTFGAYAPVIRDDRMVAVLEMRLRPEQISAVLAAQNQQDRGTLVALADDRLVLGAAGPAAPPVGTRLPDWVAAGRLTRGLWPGHGEQICAGVPSARVPGWTVQVCMPSADYDALWLGPLLRRGATALASLGLGLLAASLLASRLVRPLAVLTDHARAVVAGSPRPRPMPASDIAEFEALRLSLGSAEATLRRRMATERMATRHARISRELFASVLDGAPDGIQVHDLDGCCIAMNRAALAVMRLTRDESLVMGRTVAELYPPDVAQRIMAADRAVMATGEIQVLDVLLWGAGKGGRLHTLTKAPWRAGEGRIAGVVTMLRDVTEVRAAEARLRALQAELLRATRLSAMGAMAGGLAHEVNQPLAAATNYLNAAVRLLDRAPGGNAPADNTPFGNATTLAMVRVALADASTQMLRAGAIVRRLHSFVSRGEAELRPEDVAALIREACDLARADGTAAGVVLALRLAPDVGAALLDRTQTQQVLLNLIRNAAEAIRSVPPDPERPGVITISAERSRAGGVAIAVADTGPGLAPEIAARLFEPFVSTKPTGMGIGLTICRTIIEGHGGRLTGANAEGGGMVFRLILPPMPFSATSSALPAEGFADA